MKLDQTELAMERRKQRRLTAMLLCLEGHVRLECWGKWAVGPS